MLDAKITQKRIIEILGKKGPSLPIQLSKELGISSLFVSAFLSELAKEKRIKISALKVGGSPLYFVPGQEEMLEKFYNFLPAKEIEAFEMLKKNKVLKDSVQEPSIRVALRSIRDFAESFRNNDELYWKHVSITREEVKSMFDQMERQVPVSELKHVHDCDKIMLINEPVQKIVQSETKLEPKIITKEENNSNRLIIVETENQGAKTEPGEEVRGRQQVLTRLENLPGFEVQSTGVARENIKTESIKDQKHEVSSVILTGKNAGESKEKPREVSPKVKTEQRKIKTLQRNINIREDSMKRFSNPLVSQPVIEKKTEKPKSDFVKKVIDCINRSGFRVIEEREYKSKEYSALVEVGFVLGPMVFLTYAKEKKVINEADLEKLLISAQSIPLPALFMYSNALSKKAIEYLNKYSSIIKAKRLN